MNCRKKLLNLCEILTFLIASRLREQKPTVRTECLSVRHIAEEIPNESQPGYTPFSLARRTPDDYSIISRPGKEDAAARKRRSTGRPRPSFHDRLCAYETR